MAERGRILIVEDMENWQDLLRTILEDEKYSVEVAPTYLEAKAILEAQHPHVAVVDIRLVDADDANVDGLRLLEEIYKRGWNTAVVLITGYCMAEDARIAVSKYRTVGVFRKSTLDSLEFREVVREAVNTRLP